MYLCHGYLVSNLKFIIIIDLILSDIFRINHEHNTIEFVTTRLGIVKCALTLPKRIEDWRMIAIFQIYIKCVDKNRKITIDNKNYINVISYNIVTRLGLKSIMYYKSYNISWINTILVAIREICFFFY